MCSKQNAPKKQIPLLLCGEQYMFEGLHVKATEKLKLAIENDIGNASYVAMLRKIWALEGRDAGILQ